MESGQRKNMEVNNTISQFIAAQQCWGFGESVINQNNQQAYNLCIFQSWQCQQYLKLSSGREIRRRPPRRNEMIRTCSLCNHITSPWKMYGRISKIWSASGEIFSSQQVVEQSIHQHATVTWLTTNKSMPVVPHHLLHKYLSWTHKRCLVCGHVQLVLMMHT